MDYNQILDFSTNGESKLEILKFSYSWADEVGRQEKMKAIELEEEEERKKIMRGMLKKVHQEMIDAIKKRISKELRAQTEMIRRRKMMEPVYRELVDAIKKRISKELRAQTEMIRRRKMMEPVYRELVDTIIKRTSQRFEVRAEMTRKREMMESVHRELVSVQLEKAQRKKFVFHIMSKVHQEIMMVREKRRESFVKEYITNIITSTKEKLRKEFAREHIQKVMEMALEKAQKEISSKVPPSKLTAEQVKDEMHMESKNSNSVTKMDMTDDEREDSFVPRRLFLINVDFFKDNSQNVMKKEIMSIPINSSASTSEENHEPVKEKEISPAKRRGLRKRILKFLGLK